MKICNTCKYYAKDTIRCDKRGMVSGPNESCTYWERCYRYYGSFADWNYTNSKSYKRCSNCENSYIYETGKAREACKIFNSRISRRKVCDLWEEIEDDEFYLN